MALKAHRKKTAAAWRYAAAAKAATERAK
jgi:hypothetical protein